MKTSKSNVQCDCHVILLFLQGEEEAKFAVNSQNGMRIVNDGFVEVFQQSVEAGERMHEFS